MCALCFCVPQATAILKAARAGREQLKLSPEEVQQRMATRLINEAAFCLQDGVIENPVDGACVRACARVLVCISLCSGVRACV